MSSNTIYHIHHIVPKHAGGTDDPSNLIRLTVEEHAEAHRILYEKYGRLEDKLAWQGLSGLASKKEIHSQLSPVVLSKKYKDRMSKMTKEERSEKFGSHGQNNPFFGKKHTKELQDRISNKISKSYILITPKGKKYKIRNLNQYCKDNGLNRDALMVSMKNGEPVKEPRSQRQPTATRYATVGYQLILSE